MVLIYGSAMAGCSHAVSILLDEVLCSEKPCSGLRTDSAVHSQLVCGGCSGRGSNAFTQMKTVGQMFEASKL